jgi:hypothetical protein
MKAVEDRDAHIKGLEQRISILEDVCAAAYQLAGAVGAPEKVLDNLAAAAEGMPIPHATFLPVSAADCDEIAGADTPAAISRRTADTPCCD